MGSYLDGFQMPEAHVRRATEINMGSIAFTEHGNIDSHVKAEVACEKQGVKAIFGCEVYTGRVGEDATQRKYHLTLLAMNAKGYHNLLQLVNKSFSEGFHYKQTVSWEMLKEHNEGIICLSGCQSSLLFCSAVGGGLIPEDQAGYKRAKEVARRFKSLYGDRYYIEVQAFPELDKTRAFNPIAARIAAELNIGLVGTMDCHYTAPEEVELQKVLHNVRPGSKQTLEEQVQSWGYTVPLCPPPNDMSIFRRLKASGLAKDQAIQAIANTETISQRCNVTLPRLPMVRFPLPDGYTSASDLIWDWLREGWRLRGFNRLSKAEQRRYIKRVKYEMSLIESKDFIDYFLIVADSIIFAKDAGIPVGPARGSAAGSLVCYLLRITEVNPMLFSALVFERFIDVSRQDLPDIDMDFASSGRHLVRQYLARKYGEECVNNIGTFTYYKAKNSLDDIGKVHRIPQFKIDIVKDLLLERSSGDLRASATIEDTVEQFDAAREVFDENPELALAMDLEGNVKGFGVHAAGLVVSNDPIKNVTAVMQKVIKGHPITVVAMDKVDAERQGLLKLDYLALNTMDLIHEALRQLNMSLGELYAIPLDDPDVIAGFQENDCTAIFQFDGRAARSVCGSLRPDNFKEVCDILALCRPGPLHSGSAGEYIDVKRGRKQTVSLHPALDIITADTNSQIIYQEQILQVVTQVGAFDWTHAAYIRKIISKKLGEQEFNRQWERFWAGAQTYHERYPGMPPIEEPTARQIWGRCITAGSYAFNAAHCYSYGMLAWWCMWLKRKHPAVFYAAALAMMPDKKPKGTSGSTIQIGTHAMYMRDATMPPEGITRDALLVHPPSYATPTVSWTALDKLNLQAGISNIDGLGPTMAQKFVEYEVANRPVSSWSQYLEISGVGPKTIAKIELMAQDEDPFKVNALDELIDHISSELQKFRLPRPTHKAYQIPYEAGPDIPVVWMGIVVQRNLRDIFESHRSKKGEELDPATVKEPEKNELMVLTCTDGTEIVTIRINRFKYPKFKEAAWGIRMGHDVVLVKGVKAGYRAAREINVNDLWVIDPHDAEDEDE